MQCSDNGIEGVFRRTGLIPAHFEFFYLHHYSLIEFLCFFEVVLNTILQFMRLFKLRPELPCHFPLLIYCRIPYYSSIMLPDSGSWFSCCSSSSHSPYYLYWYHPALQEDVIISLNEELNLWSQKIETYVQV